MWGIEELERKLEHAIATAAALAKHGTSQGGLLTRHFDAQFNRLDQEREQALQRMPVPVRCPWNDVDWKGWVPKGPLELPIICVGALVEQRASHQAWSLPAYGPFIGRGRSLVIRTDARSAPSGEGLLQSLVVRTAVLVPHQALYTFIDPAGGGHAFPMRKLLQPHVRENSGYTDRDLRDVSADIRRVVDNYLDPVVSSFEKLSPESRAGERLQFIFAADFPHGYEREDVNQLIFIGNNGPRAGVYLFVHHNTVHPLPSERTLQELKNAAVFDLGGDRPAERAGFVLVPERAPPADFQQRLFEVLHQHRPPEPVVDWGKVVGLEERAWWQSSSAERLEAPVGARGGSGQLRLYFGVDGEGRPCVHGLLAAMPGAGKSSLYHSLIMSLAVRYSPEELSFYLIDGKNGVEFAPYRQLPHAAVVALRTLPELSRAVLEELLAEMTRRNDLFKQAGVADFTAYRKRPGQGDHLSRVLLVVDEYQELFEGDTDGRASEALSRLTSLGRSAGIHTLLGSQRFTAVGMENRQTILANFHLRIGMRMQRDEVESLTEFGRKGKNLLHTCDSPGKVVINDHSGDDSKNVAGKVAFLDPGHRDALLARLVKVGAAAPARPRGQRVILDGHRQPLLAENRGIRALLTPTTWLTPRQLEQLARARPEDGGFGSEHWFTVKQPRLAWLGQQFTVRGLAQLVLRREASENVLFVGSNDSARYGMLVALLTAVALNLGPGGTEFVLFDRSPAGSQWAACLDALCELLLKPCRFRYRVYRQAADLRPLVETLTAELDRRRQLPEAEQIAQPTLVVALTELDSVEWVRRTPGAITLADSPGSKALAHLLQAGPTYGIHQVLSFGRTQQLKLVLDRTRELPLLGHRVALQMPEPDSFEILGDRTAARLQAGGPVPVCAAYRDLQLGTPTVRFKPFSTDPQGDGPQGDPVEQLRALARRVASRPPCQPENAP